MREGATSYELNTLNIVTKVIWLLIGAALALGGAIAIELIPSEFVPLFLFGLTSVIAAIAVLGHPEWALVAVVAYIPFESSKFRPVDLPAGITVVKVMGGILLAVLLFNILFRRRPFRIFDDALDILIVLLVGVILFSGVGSRMPDKTLDDTLSLARLIAFYFAVKNLVTTPNMARAVMWAIALSGAYAAAFGLNAFFQAREVRIHDVRVTGVYMDPNDFAAMLVLTSIITIYLLYVTHRPFLKIVLLACLALILSALVLTGSRGGMIALVVVLLLYILRQPNRVQLLAIAAALLVVTFPVWPDSVTQRLFERGDSFDTLYSDAAEFSVMRRTSYLEFGLSLMGKYPVMGVGYGVYPYLYPLSPYASFNNALIDEEIERVAHNTYLEMGAGTGFIGLALLVGLLVAAWWSLRRVGRLSARGTMAWAAANAFELALIGLMISNLFISNQTSKQLWLTLGMAAALPHLIRSQVAVRMR